MTHLVDTSICVFLIRHRSEHIKQRFETFTVGELGISAITESELRHGAEKSANPRKNHHAIDRLMMTLPVLHFDSGAARHYGVIRAELERSGLIIGSMDLLIAAHARSANLTMVTQNVREFNRVPCLLVENWGEQAS